MTFSLYPIELRGRKSDFLFETFSHNRAVINNITSIINSLDYFVICSQDGFIQFIISHDKVFRVFITCMDDTILIDISIPCTALFSVERSLVDSSKSVFPYLVYGLSFSNQLLCGDLTTGMVSVIVEGNGVSSSLHALDNSSFVYGDSKGNVMRFSFDNLNSNISADAFMPSFSMNWSNSVSQSRITRLYGNNVRIFALNLLNEIKILCSATGSLLLSVFPRMEQFAPIISVFTLPTPHNSIGMLIRSDGTWEAGKLGAHYSVICRGDIPLLNGEVFTSSSISKNILILGTSKGGLLAGHWVIKSFVAKNLKEFTEEDAIEFFPVYSVTIPDKSEVLHIAEMPMYRYIAATNTANLWNLELTEALCNLFISPLQSESSQHFLDASSDAPMETTLNPLNSNNSSDEKDGSLSASPPPSPRYDSLARSIEVESISSIHLWDPPAQHPITPEVLRCQTNIYPLLYDRSEEVFPISKKKKDHLSNNLVKDDLLDATSLHYKPKLHTKKNSGIDNSVIDNHGCSDLLELPKLQPGDFPWYEGMSNEELHGDIDASLMWTMPYQHAISLPIPSCFFSI